MPAGLDLDAPEVLARIEDEIVALAVSPGFGCTEAETGGFGKKCGFGGFAERFASSKTDCVDFGNVLDHRAFQVFREIKKALPAVGRAFCLPILRIANRKG